MAYDASRALISLGAITPSDTAENYCFGFYVGGTGNVVVVPAANGVGGASVTFTACPVGFVIRDIAICQIKATGTTATNIIGIGAPGGR